MKNQNLLILLVVALFSACAPISFAPGTRGNPLQASLGKVAILKANTETFVRATGPAGLLSDGIFTQPGLEFTNYNEIRLGAQKRILVNWVEQIGLDAPKDWKFQIVSQEGVSTISRTSPTPGGISYTSTYTLELTVSVIVPAGTTPGVYPVIMKIAEVGKPQNTGPVYFNLEVQKSE